MTGRVTRGNTLGKQADSRKPSSTKELVSEKVGPPAKGTPKVSTASGPPPKSPAKHVKFKTVEVVIPVNKKIAEKTSSPPRDEFDRDMPEVVLDKEANEDFLRELDDLREKDSAPKPIKSTSRPFDSVRPHDVQPMPINLPRPDSRGEAVDNRLSRVTETGPSYNLRSGFHLPGIEEIVANKLFNAAITLTTEELLAMSPSLRRILARKARNVRVAPTKVKSAYISTLPNSDDSDEESGTRDFASYILMDNIRLSDDEVFEVLEYDHKDMKAGSIVQRDPVEAFRADLPEDDERRKLIIVAGRSSSLRCIRAKINNQEGITEAILDSGCQIVAIDQQVAVDLNLTWDPTVTIRMQDVHGGLEETVGLARNVPFKIGEITIYLQLHVQRSAPFLVLIGRPFDVLTESVIKNHANGNQEVTITDPNTGNKCTLATYIRTNTKRARFDGTSIEPRLVPEQAEPSVKEEANFITSRI